MYNHQYYAKYNEGQGQDQTTHLPSTQSSVFLKSKDRTYKMPTDKFQGEKTYTKLDTKIGS